MCRFCNYEAVIKAPTELPILTNHLNFFHNAHN